jgi:release factor glutamine methyltransferase
MNALLSEITTLLDAAGLPGSAAEARRILDAARAGQATTLPLTDAAALSERVLSMARRRAQGEPLAYVTGRELFMGLELIADAGALVPREETELLGHTALALLGACGTAAPRVIDMCCGSGNLACALATRFPAARIWASDLTDGCVSLARRNVAHTGVADRVAVAQGDLFAGLVGLELEGTADLIVCNPPYISQGRLAGDRAPLLEHEPREAFDGGPYGLSIHQRVIREALPYLREGGTLMFEIGLGQDRQLIRLFDRAKGYSSLLAVPNAAGEVRVVAGRKESKMASASITGI